MTRNSAKKVATCAERAKTVNYSPPAFKYNLEQQKDVRPLLIAPEKTALLVIDVQNFFTEPGAPLAAPDGPQVVVQINKLVDYCRAHNIPIIYSIIKRNNLNNISFHDTSSLPMLQNTFFS